MGMFMKLLQHLALNTTQKIVGGAIANLETCLVVVEAKELVDAMNQLGQPPLDAYSSVLEFVQLDGATCECLAIAHVGNDAATRQNATKVSLSVAKHLVVKCVHLLIGADGTVASLMPAARVVDSVYKEIQKVKQHDDDNHYAGGVDLRCKLVKTKVVMHWVKKCQAHVDNHIINFIPTDFTAIVSTQVTASINQVMFTRAKVPLVQAIDDTCEQHEFFKRLDCVLLVRRTSSL